MITSCINFERKNGEIVYREFGYLFCKKKLLNN